LKRAVLFQGVDFKVIKRDPQSRRNLAGGRRENGIAGNMF